MPRNRINSIEKPKISETALTMLDYFFRSRIFYIESQKRDVTTFPQQMKIQRLNSQVKKFIHSRPYSFFKLVALPENGSDLENADFSLEVKNFDYYVEDLNPDHYVLVISTTWDNFSVFRETVDKNLIPMRL